MNLRQPALHFSLGETLLLMGTLLLVACGLNKNAPPPMGSDRPVQDSSTSSHQRPKVDSSKKHGTDSVSLEQPVLGSVAYYCPTKMIIDQEYFITVTIAKEQLDTLIREVQKVAAELNPQAETKDVNGESLLITKKMKVELICASDYFKKIDTPMLSDQTFGQNKELTWEWLLQPVSVNHSIPIEIRIYAYDLNNDGQWVEVTHPVKSFFINIQIDPRTFWDKTLTFFGENPKFIWVQILIPLFTFFGGLWLGRKKRRPQ